MNTIGGLRFLSLAKVGLNTSMVTRNPSQGWCCDTKPCEGCTACCEELESTFARDKNLRGVVDILTLHGILGRPYQIKAKAQIRNPGNAYVGR